MNPAPGLYWQSSPEHVKARAALDALAKVPLAAPEAVWRPVLLDFLEAGADSTHLTRIGCVALPELVARAADLGPAYAAWLGSCLVSHADPPEFARADFDRAVADAKLAMFHALLQSKDYSERKYITAGLVGLIGERDLARHIFDHTDEG